MKLLFTISVFIGLLMAVGGFHVTFHPFRISMPCWAGSLGWLLIIIGVILISINEHNRAYKEGVKKGSDMMLEMIQEKAEGLITSKNDTDEK